MRLSNNGFTLAEVLVAMTIVGIIAASTIPLLTNQTQKSQVGPTLGRAIEQIEVGCRNVIEFANSNIDQGSGHLLGDFDSYDLLDSEPSGDNAVSLATKFVALSPGYLGLEPVNATISPKKFNGTASDVDINGTTTTKFVFKKFKAATYVQQNAVYEDQEPIIDPVTGAAVEQSPVINITESDPSAVIATYYIDTNGVSLPNTFGKDLFVFELQNDCRMVPKNYANNTCTRGAITDGLSCGKQIVKDKFKVTYY